MQNSSQDSDCTEVYVIKYVGTCMSSTMVLKIFSFDTYMYIKAQSVTI
jgi:hypothetical protein